MPRIYLLLDRLIHYTCKRESAMGGQQMKKIFGAIRDFYLKAKKNIQSVVSLSVRQTGYSYTADRFVKAQPGEKITIPDDVTAL